MRRSLQKILDPQLLVNASNIQPVLAFIQPVQAAVIQKLASSSACFAAGGADSSQLPPKRTQHSRRRPSRKVTTVPKFEPPTKKLDTLSLDRNVRLSTSSGRCQIWNESQHRIRASSIPQYAFGLLIKLKLAGKHCHMHWSGTHNQAGIHQTPVCRPRCFCCGRNCARLAA